MMSGACARVQDALEAMATQVHGPRALDPWYEPVYRRPLHGYIIDDDEEEFD